MNPLPIQVLSARINADGSAEALIESARVGDVRLPRAWCRIGGRPLLLALGISLLNDEEDAWWHTSYAEIPERSDLGIVGEEIQGYTTDPMIVVLARRAWDAGEGRSESVGSWLLANRVRQAQNAADAAGVSPSAHRVGLMTLPTRAEAEAELDKWMTPEQLYSRHALPTS